MGLLRGLALCVPAIRRLHESRDTLLAEREAFAGQPPSAAGALAEDPEAAAIRIARAESRLILTDYPYDPHCRPLEAAAGGRRLAARLQAEEARYADTLRRIARHIPALQRIPREPHDPPVPFWANDWFPPFDAASLYGLIAEHAPRRYIEVGSGMSTRFARQAIRDLALPTRIVSIDPMPRSTADALCDEVIRGRLEDVPRDFWEAIGPDDLLFVDNSHRSFPNSDVTVVFTDVLPALPPGTLWGLHDIFLPWDYPESWRARFYNEQYLLLAYLLGGGDGDEIVLPVNWAAARPALHDILAPLWTHAALFSGMQTHGGIFWMRRGAGQVRAVAG